MVRLIGIISFCGLLQAEVHTVTLKQAVQQALAQNPDIALAHLDEQKAVQGIRLAKDPFSPRVGVGSGLAYSSGFPLSIEGAAPSVVQARASQYLYNRQQTYLVAEARENARGAGFVTASKRDEIAYRTAALFVDADRAARLRVNAAKQVESLGKVLQTVRGRVQEGKDLPIETKRANLELQRAKQRLDSLAADEDYAERSLALVLGFGLDDSVRPADEERQAPNVPTEEAAVENALQSSKELKRLESAMIAKGLDAKAQRAARLPHVDLVAQYALLAKYNNYDLFFNHFQRHNGQLGVSFQLPLLTGPGVNAGVAQANADASHLRIELNSARDRIALDVHQAYQEIHKAELAQEVSGADLEVARESLSILLAQMGEGRASLRQVEEARFLESEKWIAFYDAQFAAEKARLNVLRQTGDLVASLK